MGLNTHQKAEKYPARLRSPHITGKVVLPEWGIIRFPLKQEYERQRHTLEGLRAADDGDDDNENILEHLSLPDDRDEQKSHIEGATEAEDPQEDIIARALRDDDPPGKSSSSGPSAKRPVPMVPLSEEVADVSDDIHMGMGYEYNDAGHRCRRDSIGRLYPVDLVGNRISKRVTSKPGHISSHVWLHLFKEEDRIA